MATSQISKPIVSIGLPVYNGARSLCYALDSLLSQSFVDFELIISDNASTDETHDICVSYALKDPRIKYIRQKYNIGAMANFQYVLDNSVGKYFMWAAADDYRSPNFLESNVNAHESFGNLSASMSPNCFEGEQYNPSHYIRFSLSGDFSDRLITFFQNAWFSHGVFYSLMRSEFIKAYKPPEKQVIAHDWLINVFMLSKGTIHRSNEGLLVLGKHGASRSGNPWKSFRNNSFEIFFPLFYFTRYTCSFMGNVAIRRFLPAVLALIRLNIDAMSSSLSLYFKDLTQN